MLYSIGHGTRGEKDFLDLVSRYHLACLADVRSVPRSRFNPQFNSKALEQSLAGIEVEYVLMGDTLGGRPSDLSCYVNGKISYSRLAEKDFYQRGIARLLTENEKGIDLAILCSERKPQECHRSRLIGKTLLQHGIDLLHIDERGDLVRQSELASRYGL